MDEMKGWALFEESGFDVLFAPCAKDFNVLHFWLPKAKPMSLIASSRTESTYIDTYDH